MSIWLRPEDRRPAPEPLETDDRRAVLVGIAAWIVALGVMLLLLPTLLSAGGLWILWTAVVGLAIGVVLLVYTHLRRHRR